MAVSLKAQNNAVRIETQGTGKPIIFLPGFTCSASVWDSTILNLTDTYKNIKVSYAGFGGIPSVAMPWYPKLKDDIAHYVVENSLTNITIIGHSMGGSLAIDLAASLGERVEKLVLVDVIPCMHELIMPGVPANALQYDSPYNNQLLQMPDEAFKQIAEGMARNMTNRAEKFELLTIWMLSSDRETYVYGYTDLLKLDLREALKLVTAKTMIIGASYPDVREAESVFESQFSNLINKRIVMAPANCKHFVMFDASNWFYNQINTFLEE